MSLPISSQPLPSIDTFSTSAAPRSGDGSFQNVLESAINHVEESQANASRAVDQFMSGQGEELHSVALAIQRAELEFNLVLQIRNKVVSAYQDVMKMQV